MINNIANPFPSMKNRIVSQPYFILFHSFLIALLQLFLAGSQPDFSILSVASQFEFVLISFL